MFMKYNHHNVGMFYCGEKTDEDEGSFDVC